MTKHMLKLDQKGNLNVLFFVVEELGWKREVICNAYGEKFIGLGDFIAAQPAATVLKLISIHSGVYGFFKHPTPAMTRLHALKWKI